MGKCRQGLKSTLGQQSSGQYSLTTHKNFTQPNHPLQEKISLNQAFCSQFCFIPIKWRQGLKSTLGQQRSRQYSLTSHKNFTQPNHPLQEKISLNQHFVHNFASFQVNKCPIYVQMETGLKIDLRQQSSGQYSLTSLKN